MASIRNKQFNAAPATYILDYQRIKFQRSVVSNTAAAFIEVLGTLPATPRGGGIACRD
jgi:hypothetical protein